MQGCLPIPHQGNLSTKPQKTRALRNRRWECCPIDAQRQFLQTATITGKLSKKKTNVHSKHSYLYSFFLKVVKSPHRTITRDNPKKEEDNYLLQYKDERERALVQDKIKSLQEEVCKQQTIIGQASQALNFCMSTIEFSGSREQVEGESVLLVACEYFYLYF